MSVTDQTKHLPQELAGLYLGISLSEFKQIKRTHSLSTRKAHYITYFHEKPQHREIEEFVYQFDKHDLLYAVTLKFKSEQQLQGYAYQLYGSPNQGKEWLWKVSDFLYLKVWGFGQALCIANASYFRKYKAAKELEQNLAFS